MQIFARKRKEKRGVTVLCSVLFEADGPFVGISDFVVDSTIFGDHWLSWWTLILSAGGPLPYAEPYCLLMSVEADDSMSSTDTTPLKRRRNARFSFAAKNAPHLLC